MLHDLALGGLSSSRSADLDVRLNTMPMFADSAPNRLLATSFTWLQTDGVFRMSTYQESFERRTTNGLKIRACHSAGCSRYPVSDRASSHMGYGAQETEDHLTLGATKWFRDDCRPGLWRRVNGYPLAPRERKTFRPGVL